MRVEMILIVVAMGLGACASQPESTTKEEDGAALIPFEEMTIEYAIWGNDPRSPVRAEYSVQSSILARVKEWRGFPAMKQFTADADQEFDVLRLDGSKVAVATSGTGGITSSDGETRFVMLHPTKQLDRSVPYQIVPHNQKPPYVWRVIDGVVPPIETK